MNIRFLTMFLCCAAAVPVWAYPPAPFHRIYGTVRDEAGNPLSTGTGTIILSGQGGQEIIRGLTDASTRPGINYSLSVPMDSGTTSVLYVVSALRPTLPFTIRVIISGVSYVPIQMQGGMATIGSPAGSTRLDLTLGIDSDGDGLPDAWENLLIDGDLSGRLGSLADVRPGDDLDGDGLTNLQEYIAGTYPLSSDDGLSLQIIEVKNGIARLQFLAIKGRTYGIRSSGNLSNFATQDFSLLPSGASAAPFYQSDDVRLVDAYVTVGSAPAKYFKLSVE